MRPWPDLAPLLDRLDRLLLPGECLLCQAPVAPREWNALVCQVCRLRWRRVVPPWCERCGQPGLADVACRFCASWEAALARVRSACWLEDGAREAVHHLKYDGWPGVARAMAEAMRTVPLPTGATLVPVPLGRRRLRQRGYNQSRALAMALGALRRVPVQEALRRDRETRSQTTLTPDARAANVRGAFRTAAPLDGGTFVLVDDVCTTGATLVEAAVAMHAAGAGRVEAVTFARAPLPVELGA